MSRSHSKHRRNEKKRTAARRAKVERLIAKREQPK